MHKLRLSLSHNSISPSTYRSLIVGILISFPQLIVNRSSDDHLLDEFFCITTSFTRDVHDSFIRSHRTDYATKLGELVFHNKQGLDSVGITINPAQRASHHGFAFDKQLASLIRWSIIREHTDTIRLYLKSLLMTCPVDTLHPDVDRCDPFVATSIHMVLLESYYQRSKLLVDTSKHTGWVSTVKKTPTINDNPIMLPQPSYFKRILDFYQDSLIHLIFTISPHWRKEFLSYKRYKDRDYDFTPWLWSFRRHGQLYVSYNIVSDYLISHGCRLRSTLKWYEEDGSSMGFMRTWTEITQDAFLNLQSLITAFKKENPHIPLVINGMREFGHFLTKRGMVSLSEYNCGTPTKKISHRQREESHEMGNCVDFAILWADGVKLIQWLISHTSSLASWKSIHEGKRYHFVAPWVRFDYIIHGTWVINKHVHVYL